MVKLHAMEAAAHSDAKKFHVDEVARLEKERPIWRGNTMLTRQNCWHLQALDAHEQELKGVLEAPAELADAISNHEKEKEELLEQELTTERASTSKNWVNCNKKSTI